MSRFHPKWDTSSILSAAEHWKNSALLAHGSVFSNDAIWTDENIAAMHHYFVENLDAGEGNFMTKFEHQMSDAPASAKQLAAEMIWVMFLCPSNYGSSHKRDSFYSIWDWSGKARPSEGPWLTDDVLRGIGSAGTAYSTLRWRELVYFIHLLQKFREESLEKQHDILSDGWKMATWLEVVPETNSRQFRHMILYLLFPDTFDRIFGRSDRQKLLLEFTEASMPEIRRMSAMEVSRAVQRIRREQEEKYPGKDLDYYDEPLRDIWIKEPTPIDEPDDPSPFEELTEGITREHILSALTDIDRDGIPNIARSATYDLVHAANRYPPQYVLSLAAKYCSGQMLSSASFRAGTDSKAFRLLNRLGFHIELKEFLPELVLRFLDQADKEESLTVSAFEKKYRGLKVKVSFGKGNFAHVPWISFTGYDQTTQKGIYPVILYYKSMGLLIVAYGISETITPILEWQDLGEALTIREYIKGSRKEDPKRYGASFVCEAFDLEENVDIALIQVAIDRVIGKFHAQFDGYAEPKGIDKPIDTYGLDEALEDLFVEEGKLKKILSLLKQKKNVILQGPPGVGKTFVSKRLAYTLMGEKAPDRVGMVQFHQSYAYEDFIQGYRPSGTGFQLKNGVFYDFCDKAKKDPAGVYVFIIDEINRGNLSKVFGELMLLIETDKRGPEWAIPLTYAENTDTKFYVPENIYLIGLMNTADRSLAMVDYALRRRFGFADLVPGFDTDEFRQYLQDQNAETGFVEELISRMIGLNEKISADTSNLGRGYCIGHSFFCSLLEGATPNWQWYEQVIRTEIEPLLREYYFDDEKQADILVDGLLRAP